MTFLILIALVVAWFWWRASKKRKMLEALERSKNPALNVFRLDVDDNGFARYNVNFDLKSAIPLSSFVAFDVETANEQPFSICSIALVKVINNKIVDTYNCYINPQEEYFTNTKIHNITYDMVKDSPRFSVMWEKKIKPFIGDLPLVAHNVKFDISCLAYTLHTQGIDAFENGIIYADSIKKAKKAWSGLSRYGLKPLADYLKISLVHHDALSDARACAEIMIKANKIDGDFTEVFFKGSDDALIKNFLLFFGERKKPFTFFEAKPCLPRTYSEARFKKDFVDTGILEDVTLRVLLEGKKVAELKEIIASAGLDAKGKKAELIERILESNIPVVAAPPKYYQKANNQE